jgi:hypothetical protein
MENVMWLFFAINLYFAIDRLINRKYFISAFNSAAAIFCICVALGII